MRRAKWVIGALALGTVLTSASTAGAITIYGTVNADEICLLNVGAQRFYCKGDREAHAFGAGNVKVNLYAGNDIFVIRSTDGCLCTCDDLEDMVPFVYGGDTVTTYGGDGYDQIFGGDGETITYGQGSYDDIGGATQDDDTLDGGAGADYLVDLGGDSEVFRGGADNDCIWDFDGDWDTCDCGGGDHDMLVVQDLGNACTNCEHFQTPCYIYCPGHPFPDE